MYSFPSVQACPQYISHDVTRAHRVPVSIVFRYVLFTPCLLLAHDKDATHLGKL
jgi:hypothetical protein